MTYKANMRSEVQTIHPEAVGVAASSSLEMTRLSVRAAADGRIFDLADPDTWPYRILNNTGDFTPGVLITLGSHYFLNKFVPNMPERLKLNLSAALGVVVIVANETVGSPLGRDLRDIPLGLAGVGLYVGLNVLGNKIRGYSFSRLWPLEYSRALQPEPAVR